ncbi:MAG: HCOMODA/2-hydroxy-3-carboxy-muconic semialdehyde decarboxylase [Gammaproteobacteria bacterium]|jgi:HCOMODA/2-hydroxy-3-carboxy-muconic semialdehyde decarboxylase|nr:HCOMODA/2-hydroxy-3-carboxy-muconic semialdehyde decarboxylase [Gammaproteobacteria bacterium]
MADPVGVSASDARRVRVAARAVARAGLVHAYGHCSLRIDSDHFIVSPAKPLGLVTPEDAVVVVPTHGALPPEALPEVLAHQYIYRQRRDVSGIVRFQSPNLTALSTLGLTPKARHGFGAYFAPSAPLHADPRLVRDSASAAALVEELGPARAIVMRGNGAVSVGNTLEEAVVMAWYLEDSARVELAVLGTGLDGQVLTPAEAQDRAVTSGRIVERMWDWLTRGDS